MGRGKEKLEKLVDEGGLVVHVCQRQMAKRCPSWDAGRTTLDWIIMRRPEGRRLV